MARRFVGGVASAAVLWVVAAVLAPGLVRAADPGELFPDVPWSDQRDRLGVNIEREIPSSPPSPKPPSDSPTTPPDPGPAPLPARTPTPPRPRPAPRFTPPGAGREARQRRRGLLTPLTRRQELEIFDALYAGDFRRAVASYESADDLKVAGELLAAARTLDQQPQFAAFLLMRAFALTSEVTGGFAQSQEIFTEAIKRLPADTLAGWLARAEMSEKLYRRMVADRAPVPARRRMAAVAARMLCELAARVALSGNLKPAAEYLSTAHELAGDAGEPALRDKVEAVRSAVAHRLATRRRLEALLADHAKAQSPRTAEALAVYYLGALRSIEAAGPYLAGCENPHLRVVGTCAADDRPTARFACAEALRTFADTLEDPAIQKGFYALALTGYRKFLETADRADRQTVAATLAVKLLEGRGPFDDELDLVSEREDDDLAAGLAEPPRVDLERKFPPQKVVQITERIDRGLRCSRCSGDGTVKQRYRSGWRRIHGMRRPVYSTRTVPCDECNGTGQDADGRAVSGVWLREILGLCAADPAQAGYRDAMAALGAVARGYVGKLATPEEVLGQIDARAEDLLNAPVPSTGQRPVVFTARPQRTPAKLKDQVAAVVLLGGKRRVILGVVDYEEPPPTETLHESLAWVGGLFVGTMTVQGAAVPVVQNAFVFDLTDAVARDDPDPGPAPRPPRRFPPRRDVDR